DHLSEENGESSSLTTATLDKITLCESSPWNYRAKRVVQQKLRDLAKENELNPWEIPQIILLEPELFSVWNGKLTTIGKLARPYLVSHYRDRLRELWEDSSNPSQLKSSTWRSTTDSKKDGPSIVEQSPNGVC